MLNFRWDRSCLDASAFVLTAIAAATASAETVVNFDDLPDAAVVTTQVPGITISAVNNHADAPDHALAYNFTAYPGLNYGGQQFAGGWEGGNVGPTYDLGKGIVVAGPNPAKLLEPRKPAGDLIFDFDDEITSFGFTIVDVEGPEEFTTDTGYFIDFFKDGVSLLELDFADFITPGSPYYDPTIVFGNHTANRIGPVSAEAAGFASFDRVEVALGGSAVIGRIRYEAVPSPTAVLGGFAIMGLAVLRRHRGY